MRSNWLAAAGDVSAAFLNTVVGGDEWVVFEPLAILKKLGL